MKNTQKQRLQEHVQNWLSNDGHTQSEISRKVGISESYISQIKNGKWNDSTPAAAVWNRLAIFFNEDFVIKSWNYNSIIGACKSAQRDKNRVAIDGYTGAGKSFALKRYAKNNSNVFLIMGDPTATTKDFMSELAIKVGVNPRGSINKVKREIVEAIRRKSGDCLIILDEGEYFKTSIWHIVKSLCDALENICGIVVCGIIKELLDREKRRGKDGFSQLVRRFDHSWLKMKPLHANTIAAVCKERGIGDIHAIKWVQNKAENYDALTRIVRDALKACQGKPVSAELLTNLFEN